MMQRCITTALLALCCTAGAAQQSAHHTFKKSLLYAGVEVGSKGVKMSLVEVALGSGKQPGSFRSVKDSSVNTDFIAFTPASFTATLNAVTGLCKHAAQQYELPADRLFTVISSGVKGQAEKDQKMSWVTALSDSIDSRLGHPQRKTAIIDIQEESRLSHLGIVPDNRRYNTFLIDIGSGNTKGGYFPNGNTTDMKFFMLNWGTKSTFNQADKRCEDDKTLLNYQKQLARVLAGAANNDVVYAVNESGAYAMNDYIAFSGGIAWSAATLLFPELTDNQVVPVTYADVEKLYHQLGTHFTACSDASLTRNLPAESKANASREIKRVHSVFDQKALMAGTGLLLKIMRQFQGVYEGKDFYLVKNGQVGWISAYVNQAVAGKPNP